MRQIRVAEQALRVATDSYSQSHICRSCARQASRQFHTTSERDEQPWLKSLQESIFGKKKKKNAKDDGLVTPKITESERQEQQALRIKEKMLKTTGIEYEVARRVDPDTNKDYLPALTWDGLERVGSDAWAKKRSDQGEQYRGHNDPNGLDIKHPTTAYRLNQHILSLINREFPHIPVPGDDLSKIKLQNPDLKLAIIREITHITGHLIPDHAIISAQTPSDIIFRITKQKEKRPRLRDNPRVRELDESEETPNVRVYTRRRTPVDKEKDIGRWKIIENELAARNLPIFGTNYPDAKENIRIHEKKVDWRKVGFVKYEGRQKFPHVEKLRKKREEEEERARKGGDALSGVDESSEFHTSGGL